MRTRSRFALGAGTFALVACYLVFLASLALPWTATDGNGDESVGGFGAGLGYSSLYLAFLLTSVLLIVYLVIVLSRNEWTWTHRSLWAIAFWAAAPLTMPTYYVRHVWTRQS